MSVADFDLFCVSLHLDTWVIPKKSYVFILDFPKHSH